MDVLQKRYDEGLSLSLSDLVEREMSHGVMFGPYHKTWLLERAPASARRHMERARIRPDLFMASPTYTSQVNWPNTASFTAVASTSTETNITFTTSGAAAQYAGIAANDPYPGAVYHLAFGGIISNTATPTVIWTPRWGQSDTATSNTTLGVSPTITTVASLSSHPVFGEFECVCRISAVGATAGTATGNGLVVWGNASATGSVAVMGGTVAGSLPFNVASGLMVSLTWSANSSSNTFTCQWIHLTKKN